MYTEKRNKTSKKIISGFLQLYYEKPISKITIKEICSLAGINRSTFYAHFDDVYDLLERVEEEMLELIDKNVSNLVIHLKNMSLDVFFGKIITILKEYDNLFLVLVKSDNAEFQNKFITLLKKRILGQTGALNDDDKKTLRLCVTYHFGAIMAVLNEWYSQGQVVPFEDVMEQIKEISQTGVIKVISEKYLRDK